MRLGKSDTPNSSSTSGGRLGDSSARAAAPAGCRGLAAGAAAPGPEAVPVWHPWPACAAADSAVRLPPGGSGASLSGPMDAARQQSGYEGPPPVRKRPGYVCGGISEGRDVRGEPTFGSRVSLPRLFCVPKEALESIKAGSGPEKAGFKREFLFQAFQASNSATCNCMQQSTSSPSQCLFPKSQCLFLPP
jgi:hypothetical protein